MASKIPDEPCASDTDPETVAKRIERKRLRRVSFADTEITSVHFFNRDDEDSDHAPDSEPLDGSDNAAVGFFRDVGGESDDFKDSDDDDGGGGRNSFLRPLGSPSPMSSAPGSATSNNEDDFFGPVSSDFIRPGLCDSAASDDFHETTMDTTAFSLHYRSIARSDSGGDMKTPTSFRLPFGEKTPIHNPSDSGSRMSLEQPKNLTPQSLVPVNKVRGGEDSNDMSIIEENSRKYDYGKLSPTLDAILAEGSKDLHDSVPASISRTPSKGGEVAAFEKNGTGHMDLRNGRSTDMGKFSSHDMFIDPEANSRIKLGEANSVIAFDVSSNNKYPPFAGHSVVDDQIQTPNQLIKISNELTEDNFQKGVESLELLAVNGDLLANVNSKASKSLHFDAVPLHDPAFQHLDPGLGKEDSPKIRRYNSHIDPHSDKEGSVFMLSAKALTDTPKLARHSGTVTPSSKHAEWYPSIQKSISRLRIPEPSPRASSLKDEVERLKCRSLSYSFLNAPLSTVLADISKDLQRDFNKSPTFFEKQVGDLEKRGQNSLVNTGTNGNGNPVSINKLEKKNSTDTATDEASVRDMFTDPHLKDKFDRPLEEVVPHPQLLVSGSKKTQHLLISENSAKGTMISSETDSLLADEREKNLLHVQVQSENNFQTPLSGAGILNIQLRSPDKRFQPGLELQTKQSAVCRSVTEQSLQSPPSKDSKNSMEGQSQSPPRRKQTPSPPLRNTPRSPLRKEPNQSPYKKESARSPSPRLLCESPSGKEQIFSPVVKGQKHSPLLKELIPSPFRPSYAEQFDNVRPVGKDMVSSKANSKNHSNEDCYQGLISQSPLTKQDAEFCFGRKRRHLEKNLEDGVPGSQRSSKVYRSENYDPQLMSGRSTTVHNDREKYGAESGDTIWESWADILVKFSGDSEQLLSPLTKNLTLKAIGVLEDILIYLVKAKKYEMLCAEIQSQKINCISAGNKRVAEARLLLYRLAYEKAKLQLMQLKRQKLQSKLHLLSSAVQESNMLKLNFTQCQSEAGKRDSLIDERRSSLVNDVGKLEAPHDNVSAMRHELEASDGEIKSLRNFFHSHMKLKEEPSYGDTISLVHDHLRKRTLCRLIRQELQLSDVNEFEIKNGHYNIHLSYYGYISQRFVGNVGPTSRIVISKKLDNAKIMKAFPNMDALVAFDFVLDAEATKEIFYSRCLAQETQVTRSQICNLLDVAEEVQLARFEIVNLIQTNFHTPSDDQLDLQLCFLNCKSSRKVTLSLDMTCLKRGVYPSDILPYQIQAFESAAKLLLPQSLLTDIRAAAEGLESGSTRIMRLCKCISQVVQSS